MEPNNTWIQKWKKSKQWKIFKKKVKTNNPVIEGQEVIYLEYLSKEFDYSKYIKAKDYTGKDISNKIKVYGNIDFKKREFINWNVLLSQTMDLHAQNT